MMLGSQCSPCCDNCPADGKPRTDPKDEGTWVPSGNWPNVTWTFSENQGDEGGETWFFYGSLTTSKKGANATTQEQRDWGNLCNWYSHRATEPRNTGNLATVLQKRATRLPPQDAVVHVYSPVSTETFGPVVVKNAYFWFGRNFANITATEKAYSSEGGAVFSSGVQFGNGGIVSGGASFHGTSQNLGTVNGGGFFYELSSNGDRASVTNQPEGYVTGGAIFYGTSRNSGLVTGGAVFNENSQNGDGASQGSGIVEDGAVFNGNSANDGTVRGGAVFNLSSQNRAGVDGGAVFNDNSRNTGRVDGGAQFYGFSFNGGGTWIGVRLTVFGGASFHEFSRNLAAIDGNVVFNDSSSMGYTFAEGFRLSTVVYGQAVFNDSSRFLSGPSEITGNAVFNDNACSTKVFFLSAGVFYFGAKNLELPTCNGSAPPYASFVPMPPNPCGCG